MNRMALLPMLLTFQRKRKMTDTLTKKEIRNTVLDIRKSFNTDYLLTLSEIICKRVIKHDFYKNAEDVVFYSSVNNEVFLDILMEDAFFTEKKVWLPKILDKSMEFYSYKQGDSLVRGAYNIPEPDSMEKLIPDENTLIIMPGAAFTKDMARIGYGGGYYDKYLDRYPCCKTIAVCYNFQILPWIPEDSHDIKPQVIISDHEVFQKNI